jgi:hypothetical protein
LSLSHAFTGAQFIAIVVSWSALEHVLLKTPRFDSVLLVGSGTIACWHLGYYLLFLPSHEEHAKLMELWALPWTLSFHEWLIADALVLPLVAWQLRSRHHARRFLGDPMRRLLCVWFVVSCVLENHELFMKPHQPLHFTRGHDWTALFFLGSPTLVAMFESIERRWPAARARFVAAAVALVFLTDNALWMAGHCLTPQGIYLDSRQQKLLAWLRSNAPPNALVIADDYYLSYMVLVYTPLRAWYSHYANTPGAVERETEVKRYFEQGIEPRAWRNSNLIFIEKGVTRVSLREYGSAVAELAPGGAR